MDKDSQIYLFFVSNLLFLFYLFIYLFNLFIYLFIYCLLSFFRSRIQLNFYFVKIVQKNRDQVV
jgi:hypothetical protein